MTDQSSDDRRAAAQRVADLLNEIRAAGLFVDLQDWPNEAVAVSSGDTFAEAESTYVHWDGKRWSAEDGAP